MGRRHGALAALIAGVMLAVTGCAGASVVPAEGRLTAPPADANVLYVARAATGEIVVDGSTVTLTTESPAAVSWFTDRPQRAAGMTSLADALVGLGWDAATGAFNDPPNAELTADELGAGSQPLELASATLEGDAVTFAVTSLDGTPLTSTSLHNLELFIDDGDVFVTAIRFPGDGGCEAQFTDVCTQLPPDVCGLTLTVSGGEIGVKVLHLGETVQTFAITPEQTDATITSSTVNGTMSVDYDTGMAALDLTCASDLGDFTVHLVGWQVLSVLP